MQRGSTPIIHKETHIELFVRQGLFFFLVPLDTDVRFLKKTTQKIFYGQSRRATQMCQNAGSESAAVLLTYASCGRLQQGSDWRRKEKKGTLKNKNDTGVDFSVPFPAR